MATRYRLRFVVAVVFWTAVATPLLVTVGVFSFELLFVSAFVGLLVSAGMTAPKKIVVEWRTRVRWFIIGGALVAVSIVIMKFVQVLPFSLV